MIKTLTSLRFFAALAVFMSHSFILQNSDKTKPIFDRIFFEGYLGVTFFFVLSGFILVYNYYDKFDNLNTKKLTSFYKARFARIYPVYIASFLISIPLILKEIPFNLIDFSIKALANIFMVQSFFSDRTIYFSFNWVAWSISDEMFFYLLFPFLVYFLTKFKKKSSNLFIIAFSITTFIITILSVWIFKDTLKAHWVFYIFPPFRFIDFFIGITMGIIFLKIKRVKCSAKTFTVLELTATALLIVAVLYAPHIHQTLRLWGYYLPFLALIIWIFAFQKGFISQLISNKVFIHLGEISFSFYMIHQLVIRYLEGYVTYLNSHPIIFVSVALLISLISSHIIYKYYEIPLKNKLNGLK
ncbi:acyltransferase [Lysinibacillus sp. B2A1]|nr:acyltransferase [Lysinibacillus sp. B2A1]